MDLGYRVAFVTDTLCNSCDEAHDTLMVMCRLRYAHQIETMTTDEVLERWR